MELSCKTCQTCRESRVRDWAIRGAHELLTNQRNTKWGPVSNGCFITLTYRNEDLPESGELDLADWQVFIKALRKKYPNKIRYLAVGEYGPQTFRPHLHACLYGVDFHEDRCRIHDPTRPPDSVDWVSETLTQTWKKGTATISPLSFATVSYTAGYALKKRKDPSQTAPNGRMRQQESTNYLGLRREFNVMSKNPGIGKDFFDKYWSDIYPKDSVEVNGNSFRPPAYYDILLKRRDPAMHDEVIKKRREFSQKRGLSDLYELRSRRANSDAKSRERKTRKDL